MYVKNKYCTVRSSKSLSSSKFSLEKHINHLYLKVNSSKANPFGVRAGIKYLYAEGGLASFWRGNLFQKNTVLMGNFKAMASTY